MNIPSPPKKRLITMILKLDIFQTQTVNKKFGIFFRQPPTVTIFQ